MSLKNNYTCRFIFFLMLLCGCAVVFISQVQARKFQDLPVVKLKSLDKITARTMTFEVRVGSTVKFGPLFIKVQACRKTDPIDSPESASFLQVWEITTNNEAQWVFSGWMFASSPALSAMDHPIYDVWVLDCQNNQAAEKKKDELNDQDIPQRPEENASSINSEFQDTPQ